MAGCGLPGAGPRARPGLLVHAAIMLYAPVRTGLAARVKALTAAGLAHVIDDGAGSRLQACSRAGCATVFIDTSRNGRRHFCSIRCANQVNVANHRLRRRHAPARWPRHLTAPVRPAARVTAACSHDGADPEPGAALIAAGLFLSLKPLRICRHCVTRFPERFDDTRGLRR